MAMAMPPPTAECRSLSPICQECDSNPWKYKCPGCSTRTCSLPCVKSHKLRTNCDGKRRRTDYVPISQFDDNLLLSDYNFLEEARSAAEIAERMRLGVCGNSSFKLPRRLQLLRKAASRRRIHLLILSTGMSRRETNRSFFDLRENSIFWTVEWQFHPIGVKIIDHGVDERADLSSVVGKHLQHGSVNSRLKSFSKEGLSNLKYFIIKNPKGPRTVYRELDIDASVSHQLDKIVIIEYPTIHVYFPSEKYEFEVEPIIKRRLEPVRHVKDLPSPSGVTFREEEIEDEHDASFATEVLDLMKDVDAGHLDTAIQIPIKDQEKHSKPESKVGHETSVMLDIDDHVNSSGKGFRVAESTFEFQQDIQEEYSRLFTDMNPDEFLSMDDYLSPQELEEGEIFE